MMTAGQLVNQLEASGILTRQELEDSRGRVASGESGSGEALAKLLIREGKLTRFQAQLAYGGKAKSLVLGSYVILEKLGEGGMGQVYRARHKRMNREVALKLLARQHVKDESARQRFLREVEAAARLTHPNIVTAFDANEHRGTHYLVMEYVRGTDLKSLVETSGPLELNHAVDAILQTARGLAYAHSQNVVHRDIKPPNLLRDEQGTVKILDMGLARFDDSAAEAGGLTGTGMVMGTVDYMAPEQGMDARSADHRADIYSLGCTLYYLLTGRPVYEEATLIKRIMAHQSQPVPRLPVEDPSLQSFFERMLAKDPADRIQTAGEIVHELDGWASSATGVSEWIASDGPSGSTAAARTTPKTRVTSDQAVASQQAETSVVASAETITGQPVGGAAAPASVEAAAASRQPKRVGTTSGGVSCGESAERPRCCWLSYFPE